MRAQLKHCSSKAVLNISNVSTPFLLSFTQTLCTRAALALPTSCMARTITRRRYKTLFDRSSQRTERYIGTIPCPWERGSSRTPPCKQGCPEVYPQPSKKSVSEHFDHTLYNVKVVSMVSPKHFKLRAVAIFVSPNDTCILIS